MKKILTAVVAAALVACGGAADGDARTDTTTMPMDTGEMKSNAGDTTTTLNTAAGTYSTAPPDSGQRTTTGTTPESRKTTPGNDSARKQ